MKVNVAGAWKDTTPKKINVGGVWRDVSSVKVNVGGVWKDTSAKPNYLYGYEIQYVGLRTVTITALSGYNHVDPSSEAYFFDCVQDTSVRGYKTKTFTVTFKNSAYSQFDCTLADNSDDIVDASLRKTLSFKVDNK